jgi:hypothetical protein
MGAMENKRAIQNKRREMIVFLSFLIFLAFVGCSSSGPTFKDVVSGKITLQPGEVEAVKTLLTDAGIPPGKVAVFVEHSEYNGSSEVPKILVENEHVTALLLKNTGLKHMDAAAALTELRDLDLSFNQISAIRGLQEAQKLEELSLVNNKVKEPKGLEDCTALKTLDLANNGLTALPDISKMHLLERLVLRINQIESLKDFKGGKSLRHLDLSVNKLTSLNGLPVLPNLTYLGLEHNQLFTLEGLGELPQLRTVKLGNNKLESVDRLATCPMLESADLESNKITALPRFQRELARLEIKGNPVATAALAAPKKPTPRLVLPAQADRVSTLPAIDGSLYGGGVFHSKVTKSSKFAMARPSSFRFQRSDLSLRGVAGFNFIPGLLSITRVRVTIFVEKGRVRIYLKNMADYKFVGSKYGKKKLTEVPTEDFIYADASPGQPCTLQGLILRPKYCKYEVVLEALDGSASGITYVITNG